jgi:hypothetical protein
MPRDYIPSTDSAKRAWLLNLAEKLTASPSTWGSTSAIALTMTNKANAFADALAVTENPDTRGPMATTTKNSTRADAIAFARQCVATIQGVVGLTAAQKESVGVTDRGADPATPINPPTVAPIFDVLYVKNRVVGCQLRAPESDSRGKPAGVQGCSICMYTGQLPLPTDVTQWVTIAESSRNKFEIELPNAIAAGSTVYLVAFWKSPRLMSGPPSAPVSVVIGGGVQQVG